MQKAGLFVLALSALLFGSSAVAQTADTDALNAAVSGASDVWDFGSFGFVESQFLSAINDPSQPMITILKKKCVLSEPPEQVVRPCSSPDSEVFEELITIDASRLDRNDLHVVHAPDYFENNSIWTRLSCIDKDMCISVENRTTGEIKEENFVEVVCVDEGSCVRAIREIISRPDVP